MDKIKALLTKYGNASFSCGEYDGDRSEEYEAWSTAADKAREEVLAEFERLRLAISAGIAYIELGRRDSAARVLRDALKEE